jgi:exodeoxyribonuclease VII small subunit
MNVASGAGQVAEKGGGRVPEKRKDDEPADELSFEAALKRLEDVVADLESGRLSLEDSLARFEEGMRLSKMCQQKLKGVELRIEKLVADNGGTKARPLDD